MTVAPVRQLERIVGRCLWDGFGEQLAGVNGWDLSDLDRLRAHPALAGITGAADSVRTRAELVEVASSVPARWIDEGAAAVFRGETETLVEQAAAIDR